MACCLLAGVLAVVFAGAGAAASDEDLLVQRINEVRASEGLAPLSVDPELTDVARNQAGRMAASGRAFPHQGLQKELAGSGRAEQNAVSGPDAEAVHQALLADPAAREKMTGDHSLVGVGAIEQRGVLYVNQVFTPRAPSAPQERLPGQNQARGIRYAGLESPADGRCEKGFKTVKTKRCSHGPDPVPEGVDISRDRPPVSSAAGAAESSGGPAVAAAGGSIACDGDGVSGKRFQAIYARASDRADRYSTYAGSIVQWAAAADKVFSDSAALTGGGRRMRWVTDAACNLSVANVALSSSGDDNFDNTIDQLYARGYNRTDRIYVIWMDANVYCGIGAIDIDDGRGPGNANNTGPGYARTDSGCWGLAHSVEAHEAMHTIGGVQQSAPHSTARLTTDPGAFHCFDESDRMCYPDAPGVTMVSTCTDATREALFDCQSDDYFHTSPPSGHYLANFWNPAGSDFLIKTASTSPAPAVPKYTALPPARILDTRFGTGGISRAVRPGETINVRVTGVGGVPADASAVKLNVAVTQPSSASHLTVFPAGVPVPNTANLNFAAGQTTSNLVVAKVGLNGQVSVFNAAGSVQIIIDVQGYYSETSTGAYTSLSPARILDSRFGTGGISRPVGPGETVNVAVTGVGGVPADASAVMLNVAVTQPSSAGHLTVFPAGVPVPNTANLNFAVGQTTSNLVVAKVGSNGRVSVFNAAGSVQLIIDVQGYFSEASTGAYTALSPGRILDTRFGTGGISRPVGPGETINVAVTGVGGVPADASAVMLNVAVTQPSSAGHLTVFPAGVPVPNTANLNFAAGQTASNLVVAKVGSNGRASIFNAAGSVHIIVDVQGYYSSPSTAGASSFAAAPLLQVPAAPDLPDVPAEEPVPLEQPSTGPSPLPSPPPGAGPALSTSVRVPLIDTEVGISAGLPGPGGG